MQYNFEMLANSIPEIQRTNLGNASHPFITFLAA
jgi:hypothetical protein